MLGKNTNYILICYHKSNLWQKKIVTDRHGYGTAFVNKLET